MFFIKAVATLSNGSWILGWWSLFFLKFFTLNLQSDLNSHIYILSSHWWICFVLSELFSVARQARFPKLGSKPGWLKRKSKILPLSHEETSVSEGHLNAYVLHLFLFTYIRLTATESSVHIKSLALRWCQAFTSLARELNPTGLGEHIYS